MMGMKKVICTMAAALTVAAASALLLPVQEVKADTTRVVVLDPGHGGGESGASGTFNGMIYREEVLNWKITQYTKEFLDRYSNVKVYLTKTNSEYATITARVRKAASYNPDLLVSQHNNASESSSPKGSSVMISRGTWRPEIAAKEKTFGRLAMAQLGALGLYQRFPETGGMEYRMSENGSTYPNGGARDYYGIVAQSVEQGFPGVIIEHAFITNYYDVMNFLSTESRLKALGEADARAIVQYLNLTPAAPEKTGWQQEDGNWYYYNSDGTRRTQSGWFELDGKRYYMNMQGARVGGWIHPASEYYYCDPETGVMCTDQFLTVDGDIYYVGSDGVRNQKGWAQIDGHLYYFNKEDGHALVDGWKQLDGKNYCFDTKGVVYTDEFMTIKGKIYYVNSSGAMEQQGWKEIDGKWYYFAKADGHAAVGGWKTVRGKYYYFDTKGVMYANKILTIGKQKFYVDSSGARVQQGWTRLNNKWYYFAKADGHAAIGGWRRAGKEYYFFTSNGIMYANKFLTVKGKLYYTRNSGARVQQGWTLIKGKWYYFAKADGHAALGGWRKAGGKYYYFDPKTGEMYANRVVTVNGKSYYVDSTGARTKRV